MLKTRDGQGRYRIAIRPAGALSDVRTIDAIRALRMGWVMDLPQAKRAVELMVERGSTEIEPGDLLSSLQGPAARDMARDVCVELEAAGIAVLVNGVPLLSSLHLIHSADGDAGAVS